jgi:hypothetical protein
MVAGWRNPNESNAPDRFRAHFVAHDTRQVRQCVLVKCWLLVTFPTSDLWYLFAVANATRSVVMLTGYPTAYRQDLRPSRE